MMLRILFLCIFAASLSDGNAQQWGHQTNDRIRLSDVQTLTLHQGKMTTARRTRPVPQVSCVGGTAGCTSFVPQVVQCYNRGSDGMDVQWECKTDMDNDFRFGQVEVLCEGYESPDDPYVLKGSCGMEYTLDLTKEGVQHRKSQGQGSAYHHQSPSYSKTHTSSDGLKTPWYISTLFVMGVLWFIYKIYRSCVAQRQYSTTNSDHPQGPGHYPSGTTFGPSSSYGPPPPYPGDSSAFPGDSCNANRAPPTGTRGGGPGFWSGIGAGAGLGYLFGRRNTGYGGGGWFGGGGGYNRGPAYNPDYHGASSTSYSSGFGSSSSGSSGSREASGFGGTRRR